MKLKNVAVAVVALALAAVLNLTILVPTAVPKMFAASLAPKDQRKNTCQGRPAQGTFRQFGDAVFQFVSVFRGCAGRIEKMFSNLTVVVREDEEKR